MTSVASRQQSLVVTNAYFSRILKENINFRSQTFVDTWLSLEKPLFPNAYFVQEMLAGAQMCLREFLFEVKLGRSFHVQTEMLLDIHLVVYLLHGSMVRKQLFYENYFQRERERGRIRSRDAK